MPWGLFTRPLSGLASTRSRKSDSSVQNVKVDIGGAPSSKLPTTDNDTVRRLEEENKRLGDANAALRTRFDDVRQQRAALQQDLSEVRRHRQPPPSGSGSAALRAENDSLHEENDRLHAENEALRAENSRLKLRMEADAIFDAIDADHDGFLSPDELRRHLVTRGRSDSEIRSLFSELDSDQDGRITKEELRAGMERPKTSDKSLEMLLRALEPAEASTFVYPTLEDKDVRESVKRIADRERRRHFERAVEATLEDRSSGVKHSADGCAGAEYLFFPTGAASVPRLHPQWWGVSKEQLVEFKSEVRRAIQRGDNLSPSSHLPPPPLHRCAAQSSEATSSHSQTSRRPSTTRWTSSTRSRLDPTCTRSTSASSSR